MVVTDLTVCFSSSGPTHPYILDSQNWHRIEKELYLHTSRQTAWLHVAVAKEEDVTAKDFLVTDIRVGESPPSSGLGGMWESRPGGLWLLKEKSSGKSGRAVTKVDVLFGADAVEPRPQWTLIGSPLRLGGQPEVPGAKLTVLYGREEPISDARPVLRIKEDGKFKIVQISDTHMVTGVGICKDAIDAHGNALPESEADPLTMSFIGKILDIENPDLVVLTGDQVHHDTFDTQTALFKVFAPIIERCIPFAAIFGNHDSEGAHALSRKVSSSRLGVPTIGLQFVLTSH